MAHAPILTRSDRAAGICERHELLMRDDGSWQVRDTAGSGKWHTVVEGHCDCPDYVYRHMTCKHLRAIAAEERALAQYCEDWNARSEQARAALTPEDLDWLADDVDRDEYSGPYGSDGWQQPRPTCPDCGAELESRQYYTGGVGYRMWLVCSKDGQHRALPA